MKLESFDNNRKLLCYENCGHEANIVLEIGHSRVIICSECLGLLAELLVLRLSR